MVGGVLQYIRICIICNKYLPLELLETAHLKPRCLLNKYELEDKNIVEFMCRYCHKLYDSGFIGIKDSELKVSKSLIKKNYDLTFDTYKIEQFNNLNDQQNIMLFINLLIILPTEIIQLFFR